MIDPAITFPSVDMVEAVLRDELARGDAMAESVVPILRYRLESHDSSLFSDEIVARVRGMATDMACQVMDHLVQAEPANENSESNADEAAALAKAFTESTDLLGHLHALALEWQLTERLHARLALDPVLPPLLQEQISSSDDETAALAMKLLASQARFCQFQKRMQLPLIELPGDLLHSALGVMRRLAASEPEADRRAALAETAIRAAYDEGASRLGLLARLVTGLGGGAVAALSIEHAGAAIFLSALALGSGQHRDVAALSTNEGQLARFALALRSAGLRPENVEQEFLAVHPDVILPDGFSRLGADRAAAILAASGSFVRA